MALGFRLALGGSCLCILLREIIIPASGRNHRTRIRVGQPTLRQTIRVLTIQMLTIEMLQPTTFVELLLFFFFRQLASPLPSQLHVALLVGLHCQVRILRRRLWLILLLRERLRLILSGLLHRSRLRPELRRLDAARIGVVPAVIDVRIGIARRRQRSEKSLSLTPRPDIRACERRRIRLPLTVPGLFRDVPRLFDRGAVRSGSLGPSHGEFDVQLIGPMFGEGGRVNRDAGESRLTEDYQGSTTATATSIGRGSGCVTPVRGRDRGRAREISTRSDRMEMGFQKTSGCSMEVLSSEIGPF